MKRYTIDATDKKIGRVSSEAAKILMGKNLPTYQANKVAETEVTIINASKASITEKKKDEKIYKHYSYHPGGLKRTPMKRMIEKKGYSELFKIAVKGMLPKNKLQPKMMKHLIVSE
ncbi:MAG TPA: 50S ribosomal protein L13 [Candidatus Paceibacterota bacterium]|nr:50S ribosomal protein L13 [Candidatus Paceibacterota bacterium]